MKNDLSIYSQYAEEWWTSGSPRFRSLQNLTPFRLSLISELIGDLRGKRVLDLGCGGGLIAVPLLEKGVEVTGVDLSAESIEAAKVASRGRGKFIVGDICSLDFPSSSFDCVLIVDVLDHIPHFSKVLSEASRVLKSQGKLFVGTLNRTFLSHFLAITLGETLGFIPKGTHDSKLFIKPSELVETANIYGLKAINVQGEWPLCFKTILNRAIALRKSESKSVAYSAVFEKSAYAK